MQNRRTARSAGCPLVKYSRVLTHLLIAKAFFLDFVFLRDWPENRFSVNLGNFRFFLLGTFKQFKFSSIYKMFDLTITQYMFLSSTGRLAAPLLCGCEFEPLIHGSIPVADRHIHPTISNLVGYQWRAQIHAHAVTGSRHEFASTVSNWQPSILAHVSDRATTPKAEYIIAYQWQLYFSRAIDILGPNQRRLAMGPNQWWMHFIFRVLGHFWVLCYKNEPFRVNL